MGKTENIYKRCCEGNHPRKDDTRQKKKWMTEEILNLMEDRRINQNNQDEYERLNMEIRHKCNLAKETWLKEQCEEMENQNSKDLHRKKSF